MKKKENKESIKVKELEPKIKLVRELNNTKDSEDNNLEDNFNDNILFNSQLKRSSIDTTLSPVNIQQQMSSPTNQSSPIRKEEESENQSVRYNVQQAGRQRRPYSTASGRAVSSSTLPEATTQGINFSLINSQEFNQFQQQNRLTADRNNLFNPQDLMENDENERNYNLNNSGIKRKRSDSNFF